MESPSASRGKFNYHLDILTRAGLLIRDDDAYQLSTLGLEALRLSDLATPGAAERERTAVLAAQRAEALLRGVRGLIAGLVGGALLVSFVLLAHAATVPTPEETGIPLPTLAAWGLLGVIPATLLAALTPLPDAALLPPGFARALRAGALAVLAGATSATPILLQRALSTGDSFATQGPFAISVVAGASVAWSVLLHAKAMADRAIKHTNLPETAPECLPDLQLKEE